MLTAAETEILRQADRLRQQGDLQRAASLLEKLVQKQSSAADALHLLGLVYKQQGNFPLAEARLRDSLHYAPARADFHANLGNLLALMGKLRDAEIAYRTALQCDGSFRPARLGLARLLCGAGFHSAAEPQARQLLQKDSRDAEALVVLGSSLRGQGKLEEAERSYRGALEIRPDYGAAMHNLGALYNEAYRSEEALAQFEGAMRVGVRGPELDANRARALIAVDRLPEAQSLLEQCVKQYPQATDPQALLAKLRYMLGEEDFSRDIRAAVAQQPGNVWAVQVYASLLRGANLPGEAAEVVEQGMRSAGDAHPILLAELACARQDAGDFLAALEAAQQACRIVPQDFTLQDRVVDALLSLGRADEAMPLIREARARQPLYQWHIACQAIAARLLDDPLYEYLYDYDRLIRAFELPVPAGWSNAEEFNNALAEVLKSRHKFRTAPLDQSLRHGTQTPISLLADPDPAVAGYREAVLQVVEQYRAEIGRDPGHPLTSRNQGQPRLQGAWSVRLNKGGYHVNHVHPEGWISSAYYVQVPPEVADTEARSGWIKFGEPRYPVPGAKAERVVQPRAGLLVLFPSYMWHGTTPILGDEPRMTAPFDVTI